MTDNVNVNEVVENAPQMPVPETMNYEQTVKLSDDFVNDLHAALDGFAYVEVSEIFKAVNQMKDAMPVNIANEILRRVASFPYAKVVNFMRVVETEQNRYISLNTTPENTHA